MVEKKIKCDIITLKAVLPQNFTHILDKLCENSIAQYELGDFEVRREQLNE